MNAAFRRLVGARRELLSDISRRSAGSQRGGAPGTGRCRPPSVRCSIRERSAPRDGAKSMCCRRRDRRRPANDWQFFRRAPGGDAQDRAVGRCADGEPSRPRTPRHRAPLGCHLSDLVEGLGRPVSDWLDDATRGTWAEPDGSRSGPFITHEGRVLSRSLSGGSRMMVKRPLVAVLNDATELKTLEAQFRPEPEDAGDRSVSQGAWRMTSTTC